MSHKYGIEVRTSVEHSLELDRKNGNTFWADATKKEMKNVGVAIDILDNNQNLPVGYSKPPDILFSTSKWTLRGKQDGS